MVHVVWSSLAGACGGVALLNRVKVVAERVVTSTDGNQGTSKVSGVEREFIIIDFGPFC